tara:strand:- start:402 stop:1097 length:696 start_codon:yes stop_codon:yes gene_type:complete
LKFVFDSCWLTLNFTFLVVLLFTNFSNAQGGELLIQQYQKNSIDLEFYRKLNFEFFIEPNLTNTADRETKGKLNFNFGSNIHYRFTRSFGLSTGIYINKIGYQNNMETNKSINNLKFISIPFFIKLYPLKKINFFLGGAYNFYQDGFNQIDKNTEKVKILDGVFVNSMGVFTGIEYTIKKRISSSISYKMQKRSYRNYQPETQNFNGVYLSLNFKILNPEKAKNRFNGISN